MQKLVGIKFKYSSKIMYYDTRGLDVHKGTPVVVETPRGLEYAVAYLTVSANEQPRKSGGEGLFPIVRVATLEDTKTNEKNIAKAKQSFAVAEGIIKDNGIKMTLVDTEYMHDGNKLVLYFLAETRVDFRDIVKVIAAKFKVRIEMRQISDKDIFVAYGAIATCGRECCCTLGVAKNCKVNVKMAKNQGLPVNHSKLAGMCGKMRCCIAYENSLYDEINKLCPKVGKECKLKDGRSGQVVRINHLKGTIQLRNEAFDKLEYIESPIENIDMPSYLSLDEDIDSLL